ncbi:hypothetical protein D3874_15610 [Oleomonas cavernae]|uniref:Antitoxin n=1 Tax=Oleomonas cavernae TaxID=2320859 RepID=A0A418WE22_9PROT|nr:hypothetical protein [Oleomonas cavernae]RJF88262.1 hypothetical protein D3874_15610 [Oleomonas cavernae]
MWSVQDAKSKLSEVLRLARSGKPQVIGTQDPCVVISAAAYSQDLEGVHLGQFLVDSAPKGIAMDLPSRKSRRGDPFATDDDTAAA